MQSGTLQNLDDKILPLVKKPMDKVLTNKWSMIEKESLKKYLLQFGYGRWNKIRKYSFQTCKILKDKPDIEMKAFANDFLRTLYDQLINEKNEKNELRGFIMNTIEELPEDPYV